MHIERYGTGEQLFFGLHGWSGDHTTFAPLAEQLPVHASLYAADLPGSGQSPAPSQWTMDAITDEIATGIANVATTPITLIGNCSGALLSLLVAQKLPHQIQRLILIDPFAYWPWYFKVFVAPGVGRFFYSITFANPIGRWLTNRSLRNKRTAETDLTQSFAVVNHAAAHRQLALLKDIVEPAQFNQLSIPIDIVYGARTFSAIKTSVAQWRAVWPHARCWELPGAGHLPIEEATAHLSEIIFGRALRLASQPVGQPHTNLLRRTITL